jgi:hypothetical protein
MKMNIEWNPGFPTRSCEQCSHRTKFRKNHGSSLLFEKRYDSTLVAIAEPQAVTPNKSSHTVPQNPSYQLHTLAGGTELIHRSVELLTATRVVTH